MFLDTLDYLMKRDGINKSILSKETGIPYTTIDSFYKKGYENVRLSNLRKLCDYFKVSLDFLVGDNSLESSEDDYAPKTGAEKTLMSLFRELDSVDQAEAAECAGNREDFLKKKIRDTGKSLKEFAFFIDMPYTTLLSIVNKSVGGAALDNIVKICNGLHINVEVLNPVQKDKRNPDNVLETDAEKTLISLFRELNLLDQAEVIDCARRLKEAEKIKKVKQLLYEYQDIPGTAIAYGGEVHHNMISQKQSDIVAKLLKELEEEEEE